MSSQTGPVVVCVSPYGALTPRDTRCVVRQHISSRMLSRVLVGRVSVAAEPGRHLKRLRGDATLFPDTPIGDRRCNRCHRLAPPTHPTMESLPKQGTASGIQ